MTVPLIPRGSIGGVERPPGGVVPVDGVPVGVVSGRGCAVARITGRIALYERGRRIGGLEQSSRVFSERFVTSGHEVSIQAWEQTDLVILGLRRGTLK